MRYLVQFIFILFSFSLLSQNEKITIKKEDFSLFFFQSGVKSDTITKNKGNVFYLKAGKNRKCDLLIEIENAKLTPHKGDSLYQLVRMPGMNYRHRFVCGSEQSTDKKNGKTQPPNTAVNELKTEVNGAGTNANSSEVRIKFTNLRGDSLLLQNHFYYR